MRRAVVLLAAVLALALTAGPAAAATAGEIGAALRDDSVVVDPAAEPGLSEAEAERLRGAIAVSEARPVFVAVTGADALEAAGGDADAMLRAIADATGLAGTYAVVAGGRFRATGRGVYPPETVARIADQAVAEARSDGPAAVLQAFVRRLGAADRGAVAFPPGPGDEAPATGGLRSGPAERSDGGGAGFAVVGLGGLLLPLLLFGGGVLLLRRLVRSRVRTLASEPAEHLPPARAQRSFGDVRALAEQDVLDLGAEIYALDPEVHAPGAPRAAVDDFRRAVGCYDQAQGALADVRGPDDLAGVTEAIEESRYALAATRARLHGEEPPPRRPPCFFDPRHGPSVAEVQWAPPGGVPRPVPACAMDAERIRHGDDPEARELVVDGRWMPYWEAPGRYRGWAGGWFGGFGGPALLGGLLLGGLGGVVAGGLFAPDDAGADVDGWDDDIGGGDLGGDIGGGDF